MRLSSVSPPAQGPKNCANSQLTRSSRSHPCHSLLYQKGFLGVPAVAQQDWHLCSARIQDRSPTWHSGLKDPALPKLPQRLHTCGLDLIPGPGSSKSRRMGEKKKVSPVNSYCILNAFKITHVTASHVRKIKILRQRNCCPIISIFPTYLFLQLCSFGFRFLDLCFINHLI